MNWIPKFLRRKEKEVVEEEPIIPQGFRGSVDKKLRVCTSCGGEIKPHHKYAKLHGNYFHRGCWKAERAAAFRN